MGTNGSGVRPRTPMIVAILALLAGLLTLTASAAATAPTEQPDPPVTPVATGNVTVDPAWHPDVGLPGGINATVTQPDGMIVIGGSFAAVDGIRRMGLARLKADGTLDATYNNGTGLTDTDDGGTDVPATVSHLFAAPGGQVIVLGSFTAFNGVARPGIMRLQADGTLDAGFAPPDDIGPMDQVAAAAVQPDGRLLLSLPWLWPGPSVTSLVRLNTDGSRDGGFVPAMEEEIAALAVLPDGRIVGGGSAIVRLLASGAEDPTFAAPAVTTQMVTTVALASGGRIFVGGSFTELGGVGAPGIARLNSNGSLDATFNVGSGPGLSPEDPCDPYDLFAPCTPTVTEIDVDTSGRVLVMGDFTSFNGATRQQVARLNTNGALDPSFVYAPPTGPHAPANTYPMDVGFGHTGNWLAAQPDGSLLAHSSPLMTIGANGTVGAWRSTAVTRGTGVDGAVFATAIDSVGRIVIGGTFGRVNGIATRGIARLGQDGSTDTTFSGRPGIVGDWSIDDPCADSAAVHTVAVTPDNRVLVGGAFTAIHGVPRIGLARLTEAGAVDGSFAPPPGFEARVSSLVIQPDGKVIVGGLIRLAVGGPWYSAVRLNPDGSLDATFTPWNTDADGSGSCLDYVGLALQRDGAVVAIGNQPGRITRIEPNGLVDPTFNVGSGFQGPPSDVAVTHDGRIVVVGELTSYNGVAVNEVVRLHPTGALDASFQAPAFTGAFGYDAPGWLDSVLVYGDGSLLVAGIFDAVGGVPCAGMARLQPSGARDTSFAPGDALVRSLVADIATPSDGRVVIGGSIVGFGAAFPEPYGITRLAVPMTPPSAPLNPAVTNGDGQVAVWFTAPVSFGGAPVSNYEFSVDGGGWRAVSPASTASPVVISGLTNGTTYRVRLRARNAAGAGVASAEVVARPVAARATFFVPVEPTRVVDTRVESGGGGPVAAGTTRRFSVANRIGGGQVVPAVALAVAYNVTVPSPVTAGHVRVMPGDAVGLTSTSAINFRAGETIANAASVKVDANREVLVYAGATANVVLDIVGYYLPVAAAAAPAAGGRAAAGPAAVTQAAVGGRFTAVTPVRVYDSSLASAGNLAAGATRTVTTATTQVGGVPVVPAGASAVAYNVTVVNTAGGGHLRVMPGNVATSSTSAINWTRAGEVIANASVVGVDAARQLRVYNGSGAPVRFLVDIVGYYSASGQAFYPIDPVRTTETRWLHGGAGPVAPGLLGVRTSSTAAVPGTSFGVVPVGATAAGYNLTAVNTGGVGHVRVYPADQPLVSASALNWPGVGYTRANASVVAVSGTREVKVYNGSGAPTDVLIDINGYYK